MSTGLPLPWHRLYLLPEPQGQGSFLPIFIVTRLLVLRRSTVAPDALALQVCGRFEVTSTRASPTLIPKKFALLGLFGMA